MPWTEKDQNTFETFRELVNLAPKELEEWLAAEESKSVGFTRAGESESVGRQSGRRIVALLRTRKDDLNEEDLAHMRKVIGYIRRHRAQEPLRADLETTRWRYSLMNWGHDPCKDDDVDC
jgi:hypothetical protein